MLEQFENSTITDHFGFVFEEIKTPSYMIIVATTFSKCPVLKCILSTRKRKSPDPAFSNSSGWRSVFETFHFRDGLVWTVDLTVEIKGAFHSTNIFRFEIPGIPATNGTVFSGSLDSTRLSSMVIRFQVWRENTKSKGGLFYLCLLRLLHRRRWSWNKRCIRWGWQYNIYRKNLKRVCDYI